MSFSNKMNQNPGSLKKPELFKERFLHYLAPAVIG